MEHVPITIDLITLELESSGRANRLDARHYRRLLLILFPSPRKMKMRNEMVACRNPAGKAKWIELIKRHVRRERKAPGTVG